jgi:NAD(P)-dependent dehydrogenase (short-subunit alcohol dehydrogenase family)
MDLGLEGKAVIVTGGSKGIGLACARVFLAEGARVAIISRRQANIDRALAVLPGAMGATADLSDAEAAGRIVDKVERQLGPVDVLVNSAGAAQRTPPADLTPAAWQTAMDAKYFSYIYPIDLLVKRTTRRDSQRYWEWR